MLLLDVDAFPLDPKSLQSCVDDEPDNDEGIANNHDIAQARTRDLTQALQLNCGNIAFILQEKCVLLKI